MIGYPKSNIWVFIIILLVLTLRLEAFMIKNTFNNRQRLSLSMKTPPPPSPVHHGHHHFHVIDVHEGHLHINPDFSKTVASYLLASPFAQKVAGFMPKALKSFIASIYPGELFLLLLFQFTYKRLLRFAHSSQLFVWKMLSLGTPYEWDKSILGFIEERCALLSRLIAINYSVRLVCTMFAKLGFRIRADFPALLSSLLYTFYMAHFIDLFKQKFLHTFFPAIAESRRQSYVVNRSASVIIWIFGGLIACEMVSTYLKIPLSSTLAFGGVGGLAIGLSARDIAANFLGGMLLLFNEPFTPGDMVTFKTSSSTEIIGRVERVGWGQTRIRGRDTRPTYIPNSHFVATAVTNMERITHRKYETVLPLRFQDHTVLPVAVEKIKERLRMIPKLDVLSMPFRVSFTRVGPYFLEIEIVCYFATKSIDEFLLLQQAANMAAVTAIEEVGAALALPTTLMEFHSSSSSSSPSSSSPSSTATAGPSTAVTVDDEGTVRRGATTTTAATTASDVDHDDRRRRKSEHRKANANTNAVQSSSVAPTNHREQNSNDNNNSLANVQQSSSSSSSSSSRQQQETQQTQTTQRKITPVPVMNNNHHRHHHHHHHSNQQQITTTTVATTGPSHSPSHSITNTNTENDLDDLDRKEANLLQAEQQSQSHRFTAIAVAVDTMIEKEEDEQDEELSGSVATIIQATIGDSHHGRRFLIDPPLPLMPSEEKLPAYSDLNSLFEDQETTIVKEGTLTDVASISEYQKEYHDGEPKKRSQQELEGDEDESRHHGVSAFWDDGDRATNTVPATSTTATTHAQPLIGAAKPKNSLVNTASATSSVSTTTVLVTTSHNQNDNHSNNLESTTAVEKKVIFEEAIPPAAAENQPLPRLIANEPVDSIDYDHNSDQGGTHSQAAVTIITPTRTAKKSVSTTVDTSSISFKKKIEPVASSSSSTSRDVDDFEEEQTDTPFGGKSGAYFDDIDEDVSFGDW